MAPSTVFYIVSCVACYKLGVFNAKRPGEAFAWLDRNWRRTWGWMNQ